MSVPTRVPGWVAEALWDLLDRISTLDDAYKEDHAGFQKAVCRVVQKRSKYFQSMDGFELEPTYRGAQVPRREDNGDE